MALFRPSELREFLNLLGIFPKKSLSQHFLIDGNIIGKILKQAKIAAGDLVLEIGPGPGALTEALLSAGAEVYAVEKDLILSQALQRFCSDNLHIFCADIRKFDLETELPSGKKAKVVANLPYHITTPILIMLCAHHKRLESVTVMVQEEVARRMAASVGDEYYGSLSLFLRFFSEPAGFFKVSSHCFYPEPKVQSAVATFLFKPPPDVDEAAFFHLTRTAFSKRRKMLRASLKDLFPPNRVEMALAKLGLPSTARPEELSLDHFLALFKDLQA